MIGNWIRMAMLAALGAVLASFAQAQRAAPEMDPTPFGPEAARPPLDPNPHGIGPSYFPTTAGDMVPVVRDRRRALFEAGITLGEATRGVLALGELARDGSLPEEFLAGILVGRLGREQFDFLLHQDQAAGQDVRPAEADAQAQLQNCATSLAQPFPAAAPAPGGLPPLPGAGPPAGGLESFGQDSFWIRLGDGEAPGIFMLGDPACPYTARALADLAPDISAGRLHVRLALAPVLSELSRDLSAAIMLDPQPAQAGWAMLLGSAQGAGLPPAAGAAGELGELGEALLEANLDWMRRNGLAAVPHFLWASGGKWQQVSGVQDPILFGEADRLPDGELSMHAPPWVQAMIEPAPPAVPIPDG